MQLTSSKKTLSPTEVEDLCQEMLFAEYADRLGLLGYEGTARGLLKVLESFHGTMGSDRAEQQPCIKR